jgi:hypothetical protein
MIVKACRPQLANVAKGAEQRLDAVERTLSADTRQKGLGLLMGHRADEG